MDAPSIAEMIWALNEMDRDLTAWEADFHNSCMELLQAGIQLQKSDYEKLVEIYEKYLGEDAEEEESVDDVDY